MSKQHIYLEDLDVCAADPLTREEELVLTRTVHAGLKKAALLVLRSPIAVKELRGWDELISLGEMSPKELMPRGRRTTSELKRMRRAVRDVVGYVRRKEHKARFSKLPEADREAIYDRVVALDLNENKIRRMANRIKELAANVRRAPHATTSKRILSAYDLSAAELLVLDAALQQAENEIEAAKGRLVESNMRLVVSIAKRYISHSMEFSDLMQEGALGLMIAIDKFDPSRGFKFSTYATWWIRQSITRALSDKERTVRLPVHIRERAARLRKIQKRWFEKNGEELPLRELARNARMSAKRVNEILEAVQEPVSLATSLDEAEEGELEDMIPDTTSPTPTDILHAKLRKEEAERLLLNLSPREADVVRSRFGISLDHTLSLSQVGRKYGLSRERVRQIEAQALAKLRVTKGALSAKDYA